MDAHRLHNALRNLGDALREAEAALETCRTTRAVERRETAARVSWQAACALGFRGSVGEWERLMDAMR